ncbi:MAG: hypothetical protein ICV69_08360 [Thermoleophilaceae bacterium]|nr:hypothetical protein [Thermoleophilaceae bacterium]
MTFVLFLLALAGNAGVAAAAKPVNTALPKIAGTAQVGQVLTADPGTWSGTPPITYTYEWQRCNARGNACKAIAGASGTSYALTSADQGATIRVRVVARNAEGSSSATSAPTGVVQPVPKPPVNTSPPTVSGTARVGETLQAGAGTWSGTEPISYDYQWQRCSLVCGDIPGATATTYALTSADAGSTVRVRVTASNSAGSASATSAETATVVESTAPANTSPPTISGTAREGERLSATSGTWSGTEPIAYGYQWRRCDAGGGGCADIASATEASYTVTSADVGSTLRVAVTASNGVGSATAGSEPTAVVEAAAAAPANTSPPTISGTAREGERLSATSGTWSGTEPIAYGYQWRRCDAGGGGCADIAAATEASYTVTSSDVGSTLRVAVTASNGVGSATAGSDPTAVVEAAAAAPANTSPPTISGVPQVGGTLSGDPGQWSGTQPIVYAYQWHRCDSAGAGCVQIPGATGRSYTVVSADLGSTIRLGVTASNPAGSRLASSTYTSAVTASGSVGYRGPSTAGAGTGPTGSKPESKLWWTDGAWWASMWAGAGAGFHIFRLDPATQRWVDTGVAIDDRSGTRADALWDGTHLYVASHVFSTCGCSTSAPGNPSRLYRYSYNEATKSFTLDAGFPVQINNTSSETLVIDKDSTGSVWATWAQDNKVMVSHSVAGDDRSWITPYVVPSSGASNLRSDDISALVKFGGNKIGVAWSNQTDAAFYFAIHADGASDSTWVASPAIRSPLIADDHINLKSLQSDGSGRVFAVAKTSLNDATSPNPADPIVLLFVRDPASGWSNYPVWRIGDGSVTRPMLLIDESNLALHVYATSSESGGTIRHKSSPISSISFPTGLGSVFLRDASQTNALNNATTTKQNVTRASGIVVLASNETAGYYWHNSAAIP